MWSDEGVAGGIITISKVFAFFLLRESVDAIQTEQLTQRFGFELTRDFCYARRRYQVRTVSRAPQD